MWTNNYIHLIVKILYSQLSSIFYLSQEPLSCRVSFLKGTYNFQLFKKSICKGACTLKCTEKRFIPFASLICPHTEFKGSPAYSPRNVLYDTSFRNYPSVRLLFPSILSIPLRRKTLKTSVWISSKNSTSVLVECPLLISSLLLLSWGPHLEAFIVIVELFRQWKYMIKAFIVNVEKVRQWQWVP